MSDFTDLNDLMFEMWGKKVRADLLAPPWWRGYERKSLLEERRTKILRNIFFSFRPKLWRELDDITAELDRMNTTYNHRVKIARFPGNA